MIKKMLIANRGEIAVRIIKTCRILGIKTVVIYSECDKDTLAVFLADEAICIGGDKPSESYLNTSMILEAAKKTKCDSLHPGYGFLSENDKFAKQVEDSGLVFVGPSSDVLKETTNKLLMKKSAKKLGIPTIPSANRDNNYPLIIKPNYGGGGKGIRIVKSKQDYDICLRSAKQELNDGFNSNELYLEQVVDLYKHIDIQFIADKFGKISILPIRDCSVQSHHQKIIEETPSSSMPKKLIEEIEKDAIKLITKVGFDNVGTVEFLIDKQMNYYFLEINSRLQVEHTITEAVTDVDLVEQQIKIASGYKNQLPLKVKAKKCAIECRLYAENTGKLNIFSLPTGKDVRIDTFIYQGYQIKPYYDSLIAKIIVSDKNRVKAIAKMKLAIDETIILGVRTNIDALYEIISSKDFATGKYSVFMESD
jgi:acetyl-CoA carboxylase biotin carboxylase subunit